MAEQDDAEYRRRIIGVLVQHGFEWVVAQADSQIAEGKQGPLSICNLAKMPCPGK